jgi:hypothetical protein
MAAKSKRKRVIVYMLAERGKAGALTVALKRHCEERDWEYEGALIDGADNPLGPSFVQMMNGAASKPTPFDAVYVAEPGQLSEDMSKVFGY